MKNALGDAARNLRFGGLKGFRGGFFVASLNCGINLFDEGPDPCKPPLVDLHALVIAPDTFFSLERVCHSCLS